MFAQPLFAASQSNITAIGGKTTITYDESSKTHTISTTATKGKNAFNAFKDFTLNSNEIANLQFPKDTDNLINFVKNKIDIQGTLNALKYNTKTDKYKMGGNLYFLSSEGLILGSGGVINAGAFYAMTPTKSFMEKFIPTDNTLNLNGVDNEISYIVDRKISDYNSAYAYGVNINPLGEIVIEGKINALNGIGLYSGGKDSEDLTKNGLVIKTGAQLKTFARDELSALVNLNGIDLPEADDIVTKEGNIELVSVQNNTHHTSSLGKYSTGYSSFSAASASANIEMNGYIYGRNDVNLTSYASNGSVHWISESGKISFDDAAKISDVYSSVTVAGTVIGKNGVSVKALSDSDIQLDKMNVTSMLLELSGQVFFPFPLNIDANYVVSNTNSYVNITKGSLLQSDKSVNVNSITQSTSIAGADTSLIVLDKAADSKFNWLPEVSSTVVVSEASSKIDFNGTAFSYLKNDDKQGIKAISILSQSDNTLQSTSTAVSMDSHSALDAAITVGKFNNKALMNIGQNARFLTEQMVEIDVIANNRNNISSKTSIGNTAYAAPAVAVSIFDSEATANYEGNFTSNMQVGSFTFNVIDNILSDKLNASSGIAPLSPIEEEYHRIVKKTLEGIYSKLKINTTIANSLPNEKLAKFSIAGSLAYGGGKHSTTLNIKPGSKLVTTGDLIIKAGLNVEDTKYNASSKAKAKAENQNGAKVETALSLLITDYDYKADIILDDSQINTKTLISGKSIVAESNVYQPYQRPQKMIEELEKAWDKLIGYFTKPEHQEACAKVKAAFKRLGDTDAKVDDYGFINTIGAIVTDFVGAVNSLYDFAKLEGFVLEDGLVTRVFNLLYDVLAFKEYSNFVNNSVSSSVLTENENDTVDISGSIFVGNNSASSNILIGKNVTLNSVSSNIASSGISLNAISDVTNTTMVGGLPVLYANNSGSKSIGGSVIAHINNSEANVLAASGATIGNDNLSKINIDTANIFTPIDIIVGTTSSQNGFNAMASAIDGKSHSNVRIDEGTNLAADTIKLNSYNNTNVVNTVGALTLSEKVGVGVGLGITLLDKETQVLVQDNDEYWQKLRKEKGLRTTDPQTSEYKHEVATITADIFNAVAKTTGTINTIGVAGGVAIDDKSKYDKFSANVGKINGYASKSYLEKSTMKYKIIAKIMGIDLSNQNVPDDQQQQANQQQAQQNAQGNQQQDPSLSLSANGSAASNEVKNTTKVNIKQANFDFKGNSNRKLEASAINSSHTLAFAGAAGLMAQSGNNQGGTSVGVDGTVAVNHLTNNTETLIDDSVINDAAQVNAISITGGETVAAGLGLQVIASSHSAASAGSASINASINLINNNLTSKVNKVTNKTSKLSYKTNMIVTAYESDAQVTGGVSASVGKQKGAVGVSLDIAKIDINLTSEISNSNLKNMKNVEVNALQASTIVNAGIAFAAAAGTENSGIFSGCGVYSELTSNNSANITSSTINSDALAVRAQDVRTSESGAKTYESNLDRNGTNIDFIDKDGKTFYTGLETASGTTELGAVASGRKGSLLVTASLSGGFGGTAVGLGAAINEIDNSFNVNVSDSNITSTKFNADAVSHTDAITIGVGAAVSTDDDKGSGVGSAAWNQIKNNAHVKLSKNTLKSDSLKLKSLNDSTLVGVGGAVAVSSGNGGVGASVEYNAINNSAISKLYGGSVTGISSSTSELNVNSENSSNIWGIALTVGASKKVAVSGTLVINEIDNNASAMVGSSTASLNTNIDNFKSFNVLATDSSDIKSLSGGVTGSKEVAVGGAIAVNQIGGDTLAGLENSTFNSNATKLKAYSDSEILSMAIGAGGSGKVAVQGTSVVNDIFRDVSIKVNNSTINNTESELEAYADSVGKTGGLSLVAAGSKNVAVGAGVSVSRIGGEVSSEIAGSTLKLKSLYSEANSNKRISNIGVGGTGSADASVNGSVVYNEISGQTSSKVIQSTVEAENNISVVAKSDDTLNNYVGKAQGSGKAAVGVSLSINNISGDTVSEIQNSNITAKGKDSSKTVAINSVVDDSKMNNKYASSSSIDINYSLHDERKEATATTGLQVDSSSTHTLKSFVASIGGSGAAAVNANVNVNIIDGSTRAELNNSTLNKGLDGNTAGNVAVKTSDYSNTAGFIGSIAVGGNAGVGASFDTNKINRDTIAKANQLKNGSIAKDLQVKANSKQGFSSVVAGIAGSGQVAVAGNVSIGLNNGKTIAEISDSKVSVNSLDVNANHYARGHVLAGTGAVGVTVAGVGASVVVTNDLNTVSAEIGSSTIDINKNSGGDIKVNAVNDDNFEAASASLGGGLYAGVAGAVAVNYIENKINSTIATSTIGTSSNRAKNIEIKSKDVSRLEADGGTISGGIGAVGASVFVNTYDGQTNTNISNSKIYSTNNVDIGAHEERNGNQYAVGVAGGIGAVGSNILVINSGKKLDVKESGSTDANTDLNAALGMADKAVNSDYISNNNHRALTDKELAQIFDGKPTYTAAKDGNSVTLTNIEKSLIDSSSGKITSNTVATGSLKLNNYAGAAGIGGILGGFGFIYDNKNVVTSVLNSNISAGNGIDIRSNTGGTSNMDMLQATAGAGDYCGAFAYINQAGNTSVGIAGSRLDNKKDSINIIANDEASGNNNAYGLTYGAVSVGTIISKAKNNSSSDITVSNSRVANNGSYTNSNSITISSEKNNSLNAIGYSGTISGIDVMVVSTLAQDEGKSTVKLGAGNYFEANELNVLASNRPDLYSKFYQWSAGLLLGVGVGDVTTREYGTAKLNAVAGSKYNVNTINMGADMESNSSQISEAYTVTVGADIHVNKADTLSSSNVEVDVNIGKDDFDNKTVLNVYAENNASATMDVYGVSVGGILSVANNSAKAIASLTTNVNVNAVSGSKLSQINVHSASDAYHKLHANGDGGGLISISPYSASTESNMVLKTNTNLSKNLTADKIAANAIGTAKGYLTSDATQGELVGGCGTQASFDYNLDSKVNVKDNAKLTANIVELKTQNNVTTGSERNEKNNKTSSYGLETGARIDSEQKITGTSQVNIGKNATILASEEINIDAKTQANLYNKAQLSGAGFGSHLGSHANNTITFNNNIITEEGSLLKTDKAFADINLASSYNFIATYSAYSEVEGAGEGNASAEVVNEITINDKIELNGDIYSYNDINLYTDKDSSGVVSSYKMYNEAEAYTRAVIPWETSADIDNDLKRNNTININKNSDLKSVRHTTLSAKDISLSLKNFTKEYNWYKGSDEDEQDICTVSEGKSKGGLKEKDEINVTGNVTAGIHNNINVKIDGKVVFDTNITGDGVVRAPTIDCNTEEYKNAFKTGTMDYGNELFNRYLEVEKLYNEYSTTEQIKLSYAAEMQRLINEMEKYGLYDTVDKKVIAGLSVDYIELPDMVCSGGNIYINAINKDSVKGKGKLKAQGAPKIKVENNSNLYMKVNDLTVVEPGGDIVFNNLSLGQNAKSTLSNVTTVETDDSKGSEIRVNENWKNRFEVNYKDPEDGGKIKTTTANPLTNIEINGHITDEYGNVIFYNANKDIVLQGKTAKDSASIDGASISISAPNGSIAQGYTEGITNIGYTPEAVLKDYATQQENAIIKGKDLGLDAKDQKKNILTETQIQNYVKQYQKSSQETNDSASGVWLAGGSIYLNGEIINLNGIVQSGYSNFEVVLSDNEKARIQTIKDNYNNSGKPQITDSYLEQNCRINDSGMKWYKDAKTGVESYKYVVQAYYNPQTDTIVLEDIQSSGGKIYLTGKIVNTSGGKIYAADGSSDITVINDTGYKLTANTLDVGDRQGFISIMDLAKSDDSKGILATLTEMTSDSTKVWYVTKDGTDRNKPDSTSGLSSIYNPKSGLTYNWSTGYKESYEYRYEETYKFTVWGAIDYDKSSSESLMKKVENGTISPTSSGKNDKISGRNVENPIVSPVTGYSLYFQNNAQYRYGPVSGGHKKYNSWVHFSGKYYGWAEYKYGSTRDYQHSIKADYPISINFLSGSGDINLTTNSDLQLNSDVISKYGNVKLSSSNGSIEQTGGLFYADKIWLNATNGIGSKKAINQKMQSESGTFSAITTSGDVNLISKNKAGVKEAKLKLAAVTDKGNANVTTDASMLQSGNAIDVKGSRIDLVSNYGSIGTKDALLKINAGQEIVKPGDTLSASVNAKANGDVALNQTSGDMRIGKIISEFGDAYITSAGSVLDALPSKEDLIENQEAERLIAKWKELGIISDNGKDNSAEKRAEAITVYKNSVYTAFARYTALKERFAADKNDTNSDTYKEYQSLKERFVNFSSGDEWLDAQNKDRNSQWYKLQNDVVFGWTQDALLYAIQDSIINRESGSTVTPKSADDANIKARNITINAGGGIGRNDGYTVVDISDLQSDKGIEALKAIAAAEASDVKWGYDGENPDKNKATINKVNSIAIDASGKLNANANDNIYFEEVNNHKINLESVKSKNGNIRVYGSNGIYNSTSYKEGDPKNIINLSGKDLIIESGDGSIGTKDVPVTTDMFGAITARSNDFINLYQIGQNAMTFAAVYSGASLNIRAINNILSIYNDIQADELGYLHAKEDITIYSDQGDIGQSGGKGLRVKLEKGKVVNAEGESVYLKGYGDSALNLGKITARSGDIGIESKTLDLFLKNNISSKNLEFIVRSITQVAGNLSVSNLLKIITDNGIILNNIKNSVAQASFINNKKGNINFYNSRDITLKDFENKGEDGNINIINNGSLTSEKGIKSNGNLFIEALKDIVLQKDSTAKDWMGLFAENGSINAMSLFAKEIDLSAKKNGLTTKNIVAKSYIKAVAESGDINTEIVASDNGEVTLIAHDGNITSNKIEGRTDIAVIAYNGDLKIDNSINSINGDIEAVGYKSLVVKSIMAANNFYVGSFGDVTISNLFSGLNNTLISDIFNDLYIGDDSSYLLGKNIKVTNINSNKPFKAVANGKFNVEKVVSNANIDITAQNDIEIDSIKSGKNLDIKSHDAGIIDIRELTVDDGNLNISNEIGNTYLTTISVDGDAYINNTTNGGIFIDNLNVKNQGSFYASLTDGFITLLSGLIEGETSIYSEKGSVLITNIHAGKEVDIRVKKGSIFIAEKTLIGGDATLKSDSESVLLSEAEVVGNMKMSAKDYSYIEYAKVGGSMLMKGDETGCYAQSLDVGNDLILNTNTGSIVVLDAQVGNNSYITIDGPGKDLEINNIKTGHDLSGDLIVVSHSKKEDGHFINIEQAVAANKLIINGNSDIKLKNAYALNGKLEVKGVGDIVVELINAAKDTYISTLAGLLKITKVISGDKLSIFNFRGGIDINDIVTLNPEADIDVLQLIGDLKITNASSTRDLKLGNLIGNLELDNLSAGNDMNITVANGNINITNSNIGNNFNVDLNGNLDVTDVKVGSNASINSYNSSVAKFNRFKSDSFDLIDKGQSNLNISDSDIGKSNINLNGIFDFIKSASNDMTAVLSGKSNIIESKLGNADITNNSELLIEASEVGTIKTTNNNNLKVTKNSIDRLNIINNSEALIEDSTINSLTASNNTSSRIELSNNLNVGSLELTNKGNTLIQNSTIESMSSTNEGQLELTSSPVENLDLTNKNNGNALIHDTKITTMISSNEGILEIDNAPIGTLDLNNKTKGEALINNSTIKSMTAVNNGELIVNSLKGDELELTNSANTNINDSEIKSVNAKVSGSTTINNLVSKGLNCVNSGNTNINNSKSDYFELSNTGKSTIKDSKITSMTASNEGNLELAATPVEILDLTNKAKGTASIHDSAVKSMTAVNDGELIVNNLTGDKLELTSNSNANINDSKIKSVNATLSGTTDINNLESSHWSFNNSGNANIINSTTDTFEFSNTGKSTIKDSKVNTMVAANDGKLDIAATPVESMTLTNKSNGNASIIDSKVNTMVAVNDGELDVNNLTSDKLELTSAGNANIEDSKITSINANISGTATINQLTTSHMTSVVNGKNNINNSTIAKLDLTNSGETSITNSSLTTINTKNSGSFNLLDTTAPVSNIDITSSGKSTLKNIETSKIKLSNSGNSSLTNLDITGSGYLVNKNGNMNIVQLDVTQNLDLDSNGGNINMTGIDVMKDFNFALAGNSGVKFTDITIGNDFNVYAGKAVLNGATLKVGKDLKTYTYSKYSAPKATMRAAVSSNNKTARSSESEEGFTLILDQLNIGGGLYVDNPDVTIQVKESQVGHDVKIDAGKEKIQIDKLDVDGGNLDIKGKSGGIKLGDVNVDNDTKINLNTGDLAAKTLDSKGKIDFNVGGNITSTNKIKSENSTVKAVAGGNLTTSTVEAKNNIDLNVGGSIKSDNKIETQSDSINMVAGGNVDAYKVLAKQHGNIEAVNGDIIIGQIDGKTLVFKQDTNDKTLRIYDQANVETMITAAADYIDIEQINHNGTAEPLSVNFNLINGRAMDNVVIKDVKTDTGVNMFNLVSMYGNIHVSNEIFNLTKTYLLKRGDLSNTSLKFRLFGDNPTYSKDPDIIAFFAPRINHKSYADISFTNIWHPGSQDYYPLIAKGDFKNMFNQYTVVQEFETLRLAYEERIDDLHDDVYHKFDFRKHNNSKAFYIDYGYGITSEGDSVNLDDVEIPVGVEFDSASGEIKSVGSHIKPLRAVD